MQYYKRVKRGHQCFGGEPVAKFAAVIVLDGGGRCGNQGTRQLVNDNANT